MGFSQLLFENEDRDTFLQQHWGQGIWQQQHRDEAALQAIREALTVQAWLKSGVLRAPRLRLRQQSTWLTDAVFTKGMRLGINQVNGMADLDALRTCQTQGAALWAGALQRLSPVFGKACRDLAQCLQVPVSVAAWQLSACKALVLPLDAQPRWLIQLHGSSHLNTQWSSPENEIFCRELVLSAGESLFLSGGNQQLTLSSSAGGQLLEVTLHALSGMDLLRQAVAATFDALENSPEWRNAALAPQASKHDIATWINTFEAQQQIANVTTATFNHFIREYADASAVAGVLTGLCKPQSSKSTPQRWRGKPETIVARIEDPQGLRLMSNQKQMAVPEAARETLEFLLRTTPYQLEDIPGKLALKDKENLLQQLMLEGLVVQEISPS